MDISQFTGETGGLIAGAMITGVGIGWTLCLKILTEPAKQRISALETKLEAMNAKIEAAFWANRK